MSNQQSNSERTVTISLSDEEIEMLGACAAYRKLTVEGIVRFYVQDWIKVDYPASQGTYGRAQTYRDYQ